MMVCDICWGTNQLLSGPTLIRTQSGDTLPLFGKTTRDARADICADCIKLLQERDWQGMADRAKKAIIQRLEE